MIFKKTKIILFFSFIFLYSNHNQDTLSSDLIIHPDFQHLSLYDLGKSIKHIIFDFHDVFTEEDYYKGGKKFFTDLGFAQSCYFGLLLARGLIDPRIHYHLFYSYLYKDKIKTSESLWNLLERYVHSDLKNYMVKLYHDIHFPITEMWELATSLQKQNIRIHLLSNAGPDTMKLILQDDRYASWLQSDAPLFTKNSINQTQNDGIVMANGAIKYHIYKPQPEAYEKALQFINKEENNNPQHIPAHAHNSLMMDDKKSNLPKAWIAAIAHKHHLSTHTIFKKLGLIKE